MSGTVVYGLGQVLNKMISFLLLPFFTALLTPSDYGIISTISLYTLMLSSVFAFGNGAALGLVYFAQDTNDKRKKVIVSALAMLAFSSVIALFLTYVFREQVSTLLFHANYSNLLMMSAISALVSMVSSPILLWMQFEKKALPFVVFNTLMVLATVVLNIYFVKYKQMGVQGYLLGTLIGSAVAVGMQIAYYFFVQKFGGISILYIKQMLKHGFPLILSFIFLYVIQNAPRYFVQEFHGLATAGIFSIGFTLATVISLCTSAFQTAYYPFMMSFMEKPQEAEEGISRVFSQVVTAFCILLSCTFLLAPLAVDVVTDNRYFAAYKVVGLCATGWVCSMLFSTMQAGLYYTQRLSVINYPQIIASIVALLLGFILISNASLYAASFVFFAANAAMLLSMHLINRKLHLSRFYSRYLRSNALDVVLLLAAALTSAIAMEFSPKVSYLLPLLAGIYLFYYYINNKALVMSGVNALRKKVYA
ncbi:MAG: hypothetical protein RL660_617 [Bacteroidota bacterium]